ncbi:27799_t:CDS:2, partial [Gigaspora margarita]
DIYNSSNYRKCVVNEETLDYLAACPADKETWKQLEEEIAGKVWNSIPNSTNQPSSKEVELKTRKTEWGDCLRIVCDEVKKWIKD